MIHRMPIIPRLFALLILLATVAEAFSPAAFAKPVKADKDPVLSPSGELLRTPELKDFPRWETRANLAEGVGIDGVTVRFSQKASFLQIPGKSTPPSLNVSGKLPDGSPIEPEVVPMDTDPGVEEEEVVPAAAAAAYSPTADIVLVAWSDRERRIVAEFSHTLEGPDFAVAPEKMSMLPEGIIELQAVVRVDEQIVQLVRHPYYVSYTLPLSEQDDPEDSEGPGPEEPPKAPEDLLKDALEEYYKTVGSGIPGLDVAFAEANAVVYEIGSDALFHLDVEGSTPENGDVVMVAFSVTEDRQVELFAHDPLMPGYQLDPAFMENLPPGLVLLQALVRTEGKVQQLIQAPLLVVVNNELGNDADWLVYQEYDSTFDDLPPGESYVEHPTDDAGWTVFPLPADARVIYCSSSEGSDANTGFSPNDPVKTPDRAISLLRNRMPDRVLFKRGDTFSMNDSTASDLRFWNLSGRSTGEPMIVGAYGELGLPRPRFLTNGDQFMRLGKIRHVALLDLYITHNHRDPYSPDFKGGGSGEGGISTTGQDVYDFLLEGCLIEYSACHITVNAADIDVRGLTLRRNVFRYAYKQWDTGFSQGVFIRGARGLVIEENMFDHNGWNSKVNRAQMIGFNHNAYLHELKDLTFRNNIVTRGSMNGTKFRSDYPGGSKNLLILGNLYGDNKTGIAMSADNEGKSKITFDGVRIDGNVVTNNGGSFGGVKLGAGLESKNARDVVIRRNLAFLQNGSNDWPGIQAGQHLPHENMRVVENVIHRWNKSNDAIKRGKNVSLSGNRVNMSDGSFTDPTYSLDRYAREQVGLPDRFALYGAMSQQRRGFWRPELTAAVVNAEFRQAFDLQPPDWSISAPIVEE